MFITQFRATVGQKQNRDQGGRQQCWSSETHVQGVAPCSARTMAISTMANRITRARRAGVAVLYPPMSRAGSQETAPGPSANAREPETFHLPLASVEV